MNRSILIVTHVFPPAGGVPVQRPLSFAKYLPENGYDVHVLTTRNGAAPVMDPSLLRHVKSPKNKNGDLGYMQVFLPANIPILARKSSKLGELS